MNHNTYRYDKSQVGQDTCICQYMDLDYLIAMLSTNKYFIRIKGDFADKYENSLPLKNIFPVYPTAVQPDKDKLQQNIKMMEDKLSAYKDARNIPTSCWTIRSRESALMWSSYTTKIGVCIQSTISDFIKAIDYTGFMLIYGQMQYQGYAFSQDHELFSKHPDFADEKELRFYFIPKDNQKPIINGIKLPINPTALIKKVILSPYIEPNAGRKLCDMINHEYPKLTIRTSDLQIRFH